MIGGPGAPAPLGARVAAFVIDLAVGAALAAAFSALAWIWLLWRSDGGARQPSDGSIYAGLALASCWLPIWGGLTLSAWLRDGSSPGLSAMALRVAGPRGSRPAPMRAVIRLVVTALSGTCVVLSPLIVAGMIAAAGQRTLPLPVGLVLTAPLLVAAATVLCGVVAPGRRTPADLAAGTSVVRVDPAQQTRSPTGE